MMCLLGSAQIKSLIKTILTSFSLNSKIRNFTNPEELSSKASCTCDSISPMLMSVVIISPFAINLFSIVSSFFVM